MEIKIVEKPNVSFAELSTNSQVNSVQDAIDLLGNASYLGVSKIIISEDNLTPQFFELSDGIAGQILQKFSNYQMQLAIVGQFEKFSGKALKDFITECNRGNHIFFSSSRESAIEKLS